MKRKGFTLIELLAVIIILGILMLIAIPSVTTYINNSRKNAYVNTAKGLVKGAQELVNSGDLDINDPNATYYISIGAIPTENTSVSPYGNFDKAYVVVTYDNDSYDYYWVSKDTSGYGVDEPTKSDLINQDTIKPNIDDISTLVGIGGREKIIVYDDNLNKTEDNALYTVDGSSGEAQSLIKYPEGKDRDDLVMGDVVKISTEEFFVVSNDTSNNKLTLITKYNINVGDNKKPGVKEGVQDPDIKGKRLDTSIPVYGTVPFSTTNYWSGKVGAGLEYPGDFEPYDFAFVYDEYISVQS